MQTTETITCYYDVAYKIRRNYKGKIIREWQHDTTVYFEVII